MRWEQKDRNETKYELAIDTVVNPIPIDEITIDIWIIYIYS